MLVVSREDSEEATAEFRYGIVPERHAEWMDLHRRTGLPQRQILHRLVAFLLKMDQQTQAMVLGTTDPTDDLIELVLKRLKQRAKEAPAARKLKVSETRRTKTIHHDL